MNPYLRLPIVFILFGWCLPACEPPAIDEPAEIPGAEFIEFRCVTLDEAGREVLSGQPLDNCGCTVVEQTGMVPELRRLGRVECSCVDASGAPVEYVEPGDCGDASCAPRKEDGDWVPSDASNGIACRPAGRGHVRAYVGTNVQYRVSVLNVLETMAGEGRSVEPSHHDVSLTIPGVSGVFFDDLISDVGVDPYGRFVIGVSSSSGRIGLFKSDVSVVPDAQLNLGVGPLFKVATWPRESKALTGAEMPVAWVSAPSSRQVIAVDLNAVNQLPDDEGAADAVITDCIGFTTESGCRWAIQADQEEGVPTHLSVSDDGRWLAVAYSTQPVLTVFDLHELVEPRQFDLSSQRDCDDGYLTGVQPLESQTTCFDGADNDGDGLIDGADDDCLTRGVEALNPRCPQRPECSDGDDNDQDGQIDADDPDCDTQSRWEGSVPACSDGMDNDGDGLVDRDDPGCATESDPSEGDLEGGALCDNGEDDDADGLIDADDPGCSDPVGAAIRYWRERVPECGDGIDNDGDGLTDYGPDGDPDCYAAGDWIEGASRLELGASSIELITAAFPEGYRTYLYAVDPAGSIGSIHLEAEQTEFRRIDLPERVQQFAARRMPGDESVVLMTADNYLRNLPVSIPRPIREGGGREVYAKRPDLMLDQPLAWLRLAQEDYVVVDSFYSVVNGAAYSVVDGDHICSATACVAETDTSFESSDCEMFEECLDGLCVPKSCAEDSDCGDAGCLNGACVQTCDADEDCGAWKCVDATGEFDSKFCAPACRLNDDGFIALDADALSLVRLEEDDPNLSERAIAPQSGGVVDLMVVSDRHEDAVYGEVNVLTTANLRTVQTIAIRKYVDQAVATEDFERLPSFCRLEQVSRIADEESDEVAGSDNETESAVEQLDDAGACVPLNTVLDGDELVSQTASDREEWLWNRVDTIEAVQVKNGASEPVPLDTFSVEFHGVLPDSESITGLFGGRTSDDEWSLLDYNADYCQLGVELGDVVVFEAFDSDASADEACDQFDVIGLEGAREQRLEPLRYRISEVSPHRLSLVRDTESDLNQVPRAPLALPPAQAPAPIAPTAECVSQLLQYHVRVRDRQWLLSGALSGYRHPWVRQGGACVVGQGRLGRQGRVEFGELFDNEWFRFRIGAHAPSLACGELGREDCDPFMHGVRFEFDVLPGELTSSWASGLVLPGEMKWLPNNDHVFVTDGALRTVVEFAGFGGLNPTLFELRRYD